MKIIPWSEDKLNAIVELWNREIGIKFPMRRELFKQNSFKDENILPNASSIAVDDEGNVIGFLAAKAWQEKLPINMSRETGWIQVLLVDSDHRSKGIGTALLNRVEQAFKNCNLKTIKLGSDPWHYFPGIPEPYPDVKQWFERRGYHNDGNEYDLVCQYEDGEGEAAPAIENATFSLVTEEDQDKLIAFMHRCFPGRWEYEAIHYFKKGGTGREFVVLKKNNEIKGFCRINDNHSPFIAQNVYWAPLFPNELGGLGPLGIDPAERGNGYGLAIVEAGIAFLRQRGLAQIVIDWTGLVDFYGKLGYKVWKTYAKYSKSIGGE